MKGLFLILFLTAGGTVVSGIYQMCDSHMKMCEGMLPKEQFEDRDWFPPSAELLKTICGPSIMAMECVAENVKKCTGNGLDELAAMDNKTIAMPAKMFAAMARITIEVCDEDSTFHKRYVNNVECFKNTMNKESTDCREESERLYKAYRETLEILDDEEDSEAMINDAECVMSSYAIACFSMELKEICSDDARLLLLDIMKRMQFMRAEVCSGSDLEVMKKDFMDYLEYEGEKRELFSVAFDMRKRRK